MKSRITHTCRITLTLAVEGIELRQQLPCTHVYNRVRNAASFPRNRPARYLLYQRSVSASHWSGEAACSVFSCHIGIALDNVAVEWGEWRRSGTISYALLFCLAWELGSQQAAPT